MLTDLHSTGNYAQDRYDFLRKEGIEGYRDRVYIVRGENIATIGVGINLKASPNNLNAVLEQLGFDVYGAQLGDDAWIAEQEYMDKIHNAVKVQYQTDLAVQTALDGILYDRSIDIRYLPYSSFTLRPDFRFYNQTESKNAFDAIIGSYESRLDARLGDHLLESKERIALMSLAYNSKTGPTDLLGDKLMAAINKDNRAEAWFEIRYNSNKKVMHARRRYEESYHFELYDNTPEFTEAEAKEVMRMYTLHEKTIKQYEIDYRPGTYGDILTNIKSAKNYLIAQFGKGVNIDGEVIVGAGLKSYAYQEGDSVGEFSSGKDKNDLIFGEKGSDILYGSAGEDVVYGGEGNDDLIGGEGDDILVGGSGNDDYYFQSGDGNDLIIDTEGANRIIWADSSGKPHIMKTFYKSGDLEWKSADGSVTLNHHSPWQLSLEGGGTITLGEDFQEGDFGINLRDVPVDPQIDNFITEGWNPNCPNEFYDTTGNDKIIATGEDDSIYSWSSGDDWILAGDGRDNVESEHITWTTIGNGEIFVNIPEPGNDIIEGGSGGDLLNGGLGDDKIFAENYGDMSTLISEGGEAQSINEQGDLITGSMGSDFVYGSNRNDALFGGTGDDLISGGGGNDYIAGDEDLAFADLDWSFTVSYMAPNYNINFSDMGTAQGMRHET